jgi:hypothetical protein
MPQDEKCIIRSKIAPSITLDDLILDDLYTGTSEKLPENLKESHTGRQVQNEVGTEYPQILINAYTFTKEEIIKMQIDATGFLPKIYLKVAMTNTSAFKSHGFPTDGDLISIFIRAKNDAFKPIRNDYLITRINGGKGVSEGLGATIEIFGELFIPHFQDEIRLSYEGTTYEVLQQICSELSLGFATNEEFTDDEQIWICPGDTYYNFIQKITRHAWKDEQSFFNSFIDVYYHLNFINVNNQVDGDGKLEASILDVSMFSSYLNDSKLEDQTQVKSAKMLSDIESFQGTNMFIMQYAVKNNSSKIAKDWGYKSYVQFFDQASGQVWEIFVDPITSEGSEQDKIILKGRYYPKSPDGNAQETYWQTQNKYYWKGIQYRDVHDKYLYSEMWNERNLVELDKMYIEADIERWNPNIYRGERIPVLLHTQTDVAKKSMDANPSEKGEDMSQQFPVTDQFYSGYYMVDGIKFTYDLTPKTTAMANPGQPPPKISPTIGGIVQVFRLSRREWPTPIAPDGENQNVATGTNNTSKL